ncbi:hypothetical protein FRC14_001307 [Serendipita sp. 396]|nr:hypothetical protein FRC14_001307 [Serendipita sp. 396]
MATEDASTIDEYGSVVSSPAPSTSDIGTATIFPRLGFLGTDSASMLGDSHVGGAPSGSSSSSSSGTGTSRSYNTPRTASKLPKLAETPTGTSTTSLVRSLPGARPRATRFPISKSSTTSGSYATPDEKENVPDSSSSESYVTASERTPGKSHRPGSSATSGPLSVTQDNALLGDDQDTEAPLTEIMSVQTNSSHGDEDLHDSHRSRLTRADSYYTSTSAGLARSRSVGGDSTYSTIAYDVCISSDISELTPVSGSSTEHTPTPQPSPLTLSSPYVSAPEPATPISSIGSIPTLLSESIYATAERVDSSSEYSTANRWPSSTEYSTVPLASPSHHTPTLSPMSSSVSVAPVPTPSWRSPTPLSAQSPLIVQAKSPSHRSLSPASSRSRSASIPQLATPSHRSATPSSSRSISVAQLPTPGAPGTPSVHHVSSAQGTPTPSVIGTIPDATSDIAATSDSPSSESSVTPTQSRTMSLASRSVTPSPMSTPRKVTSSHTSVTKSSISHLPQSPTVTSVSSLSSTSVSSITASPLPTPLSTSSRSLSSVTTSLRTPNSFLMPPVPPPSSTRSTRTRPVSEASYAASNSGQSMSSSQFDYTPSAISIGLPPIEEDYDSSVFGPSIGSSEGGHYEVVLVDSSDGKSSITRSTRSTSVPIQSSPSMASTPSAFRDTFSGSSLSRSESVSSMSSLRSSIFLPSRSSSIRSIMAPPTESEARTPRSPTVSVTMTPAQSFHPSFRDDLSTVPSEEEQALATASAPMEIITHDVNRLLEYLDGVDRQRVAEHDDVKDQLDRVEDELKKLADFVRKEAAKSPPRPVIIPAPSPPLPPLPDPTEDVVMHHAPKPAVILLDPPESPLRLSSGSVTESIQWLSSPSSISEGLPIPFQESTRAASSVIPSSMTKSVSLHSSGASADHSLGPLDSISQRSELLGKSDTQSERSLPLELSGSEGLVPLGPSEVGSQRSASLRPSDSVSQRSESLAPSDSASHLSVSRQLSGLARSAPPGSELSRSLSVEQSESGVISHSPSSPLHDVMSISSEQESGTPESTNILLAPPPSAGSTPPASVPSGSRAQTPLSTPPRTRGNTPDIDIVSASGRGSPARSDITLRQGVSNAQLRDMLNDLRRQTDKLMDQQNKTNDAIEELQNRPPIQLPALPPSQPTPRRSPYADLLSQIADTLRDIVEAGEAARELPLESDATETETESIAETEDTGATLQLNNLQNRLQDVLGMPAPPQPIVPLSSVRPTSKESLTPTESVSRSSPPPASLYEQHIADFPRIRRPIPRRGRLMRSPSPRLVERPGTAPVPSAPMWGRVRPIMMTTRTPPPPVQVESESTPTQTYQRPLSELLEDSGPDLDLLKLLQERRRQRRGGDGTYIPGGNEPVEEVLEIPPRPDSAPVEFGFQDEPITAPWYRDRPGRTKPETLLADPVHDEPSEASTPTRTPILIPREPQFSRPIIPLGELPSTASYAEMLALLRQNELMQRHQTEQQNELVRYLHDLNGWLARDVSNRQLELQGVEDRITHLQNALANRLTAPCQYFFLDCPLFKSHLCFRSCIVCCRTRTSGPATLTQTGCCVRRA